MQAHTRARACTCTLADTRTHTHNPRTHTTHCEDRSVRFQSALVPVLPSSLRTHNAAAARAWDRSQPARPCASDWLGRECATVARSCWRILARRRARRLETPRASHVVRRVLCAACRRVAPAAAECVAVRDQPVPCFLRDDQIEVGRPRQDVAVAAADQTGVPRLA